MKTTQMLSAAVTSLILTVGCGSIEPAPKVTVQPGATTTVVGKPGQAGTDGTDGVDGSSGRDGVAGAAGVAGATGAAGQAGPQGSQGVAGAAGAAGRTVVDATQWIDPVTGAEYFLSDLVSGTQIQSSGYVCPVGSSAPVSADVADLLEAGMSVYFITKQPSIVKLTVGFDSSTNTLTQIDESAVYTSTSGTSYTNSYFHVCRVN